MINSKLQKDEFNNELQNIFDENLIKENKISNEKFK
jgi:hypothetical protein